MKNIVIGAALAAAAFATPAFAADVVQPLPVSVHNWTGFYLGAVAGYGWGTTHALDDNFPSSAIHYDGFLGGVEAGYNYQFSNNVVLGAELDFLGAALKGSGDGGPDWGCGDPEVCTFKQDWYGTGRVRLGYAFDNWLPYVTGGFAYGHVKGSLGGECPGTVWCGDDTNFGWTAGGGIEWAFNDKWSVKAEYLFVDLGKGHFGTGNGGDGFEAKFRTNTVRIGLNYHF